MQGSLFGNECMSDEDRKAAILHHQLMIHPHRDAIRDLKDTCPHNNVKRVARSDTGNWCRADDAYWTDASCEVCGNFWKEDYHDGHGRR